MKMWIFYFLIIAIALTSSNGFDLYCSPTPSSCSFNYITSVTTPNEAVNVVGQAAGFVDTATQTLNIGPTSQFSYFPSKILTIYSNVTTLSVTNNSLTTLVTNAVDYCQALTDLTITNELFTNVPAGFAQNCANLKYLSLRQNQIVTIDKDALKGLSNLLALGVENNKITCIPPGLFASTPLITMINFNNNLIKEIDPTVFKGLVNPSHINFASNNIQYLPNLIVSSNNSFGFYFGQNPITAIDPQFIPTLFGSRLNQTTYLIFGNNPNSCIPSSLLSLDANTYTSANATLATCFSNWNPSLNQPVSCAPTTTTSTTTTTTTTTVATQTTTAANTATTNTPSTCPQPAAPACCPPPQGILNLMLTKIMNMTLSVSFP